MEWVSLEQVATAEPAAVLRVTGSCGKTLMGIDRTVTVTDASGMTINLKFNFTEGIVDLQCVNFCCIAECFSYQFSSVAQSLRPHELQHARPPCLSPTPGVYSNSCPSSQ